MIDVDILWINTFHAYKLGLGGAKVRIEKGYRARRANVLLQKYDANWEKQFDESPVKDNLSDH